MSDRSDFCGQPEAIAVFQIFVVIPVAMFAVTAILQWDWRWLLGIPVSLLLYLALFEGIPFRGRDYTIFEPRGVVAYAGEEENCWACKHIPDQLDCKWGSAVDPVKAAHKDDWRARYPCAMCWRSGATTTQDQYRGPVRWAKGERL